MVTQPDDTIIVGCKMGASLGESNSARDIPDVEAQGAESDTESYPSAYACHDLSSRLMHGYRRAGTYSMSLDSAQPQDDN